MPRPAATRRGPSTSPRSIARPRSMTMAPFAPRSRMVVTPARSAARAIRPPSPHPPRRRLRGRVLAPPVAAGHALVTGAPTVLDPRGARGGDVPPPLADLDPALRDGVTHVVVILADGLGARQLERLCASGDTPFLASLVERAKRRDRGQLLQARTIFPSTTAAAITTLNTARTPQEHGNLAYFVWLAGVARVP